MVNICKILKILVKYWLILVNFFWGRFLLLIRSFGGIFFLVSLYACLLSHFKVIRCIAKLLIATSTYFLFKYSWKKKLNKCFLGARFWVHKLVCWSPWIPHWVYVYIFTMYFMLLSVLSICWNQHHIFTWY